MTQNPMICLECNKGYPDGQTVCPICKTRLAFSEKQTLEPIKVPKPVFGIIFPTIYAFPAVVGFLSEIFPRWPQGIQDFKGWIYMICLVLYGPIDFVAMFFFGLSGREGYKYLDRNPLVLYVIDFIFAVGIGYLGGMGIDMSRQKKHQTKPL